MSIINAILLILGLIVLGRQCGALTIFCTVMLSLENLLLEILFPITEPLTSYPTLELIYAVLLTGIGSAIIFKCKASSGGTDIIALILKKYTSMNVGQALLFSDFVIASSTFLTHGVQAGLFSILGLFAKVFVIDDILDSMNMCKSFTIITTKAEEIESYIMNKMHHSATVHNVHGAYTGEDRQVIMTVCRRSEAINLRRAINQIDPQDFIVITKTSEIMGKGFRDNVL